MVQSACGDRRMGAGARRVLVRRHARLRCPHRSIKDLASETVMRKSRPSAQLVGSGDSAALPFLQSLLDGEVQTSGEDRVLIVKGDTAVDAVTGKVVAPLPEALDDVVVNNRLRLELTTAIAALKLASPDRAVRLAAAKDLQNNSGEAALPRSMPRWPRNPIAEVAALLA